MLRKCKNHGSRRCAIEFPHRQGPHRALAKTARDDHYIQLADYICDKADQLFEEARVRELEPSQLSARVALGDGRCRLLPAEHDATSLKPPIDGPLRFSNFDI
jgi:hypothetical protein